MLQPLTGTNLFEPLKVGNITLKHRLVMAPMSRFRCTDKFIPTDSMLEHFDERSKYGGGLFIVESTSPAPEFGVNENAPLFQTNAQVQGWKKIVDKVHANGSYMSLQLWNLGRMANPATQKKYGAPFWSSSAAYLTDNSKQLAEEVGYPIREVTQSEIKWQIVQFASAAKQAIETAGFDLVEVHVGKGFLPDQFFQASMNSRNDEYGGSLENRARYILELVDAVADAIGPEKMGIKMAPFDVFFGDNDGSFTIKNPPSEYQYLLDQFESRSVETGHRFAYLSVTEPRVGMDKVNDTVDTAWVDEHWKGVIMRAGALLHGDGFPGLRSVLEASDRTLISAGRYYTSNPDLVVRLKEGLELTPYDRSTFYTPMKNAGYLGFGTYGKPYDHSKDSIEPKPLA